MAKADLTAEQLRELVHYDPETGAITWIAGPQRGKPFGHRDPRGYIQASIGGNRRRIRIYAHQAAWLYMTGKWPENDIDHRDHDKSNNRFDNLRDLPRFANQQNQIKAHANNKTGFLGVYARKSRFCSTIFVHGKAVHIGTFDTPAEAHAAYVEAKRRLHPANTL